MNTNLPSRPNLEFLREQAKALLAGVRSGKVEAAEVMRAHLPEAAKMTVEQVFGAGFKLADAQSAVARRSGFAAWPPLARYISQLRALEGTWEFVSLEVDGNDFTAAASGTKIHIDGDSFRMVGTDPTEAVLSIDVEVFPHQIDVRFIQGPHSGNSSLGIYEIRGDRLKICLGLVGYSRPTGFLTSKGSGHALEILERTAKGRPAPSETAPEPQSVQPGPSPDAKAAMLTDHHVRLLGEWMALEIIRDGFSLPAAMLDGARRVGDGTSAIVQLGGQTILEAEATIEVGPGSIQVDYRLTGGPQAGSVQLGIMEWLGEDVQFCFARPGEDRPAGFVSDRGSGYIFSRWRKLT